MNAAKVVRINIQFETPEGSNMRDVASIDISVQHPICSSCGQDHKKNIELSVYGFAAPSSKTRHETLEDAWAEARKRFPQLPTGLPR